jgi:hypothetical protein
MKTINSNIRQPKKLALEAMRTFTSNPPCEVAINKKNRYFACWSGNKNMWLDVMSRDDFGGNSWSIVVANTREQIELFVWHAFFQPKYQKDLITYINDAVSLYIADTGFTF